MNILNDILLAIINLINQVIPSYGVAIIVFTLLIKLCVLPLDLKSRRSMQRMSALNPKLEALKQKYGNDQERYNQKVQELYQKEKISPLSPASVPKRSEQSGLHHGAGVCTPDGRVIT